MRQSILNQDDLMRMLDGLLREPKPFWENFYSDRQKKVPFFQIKGPDENLVEYFSGKIFPKRVLELGCGPGRNAIFMAKQGCQVEAVDIAENAIEWAKERAQEEKVEISFDCSSVFDYPYEEHAYDFVYDSGLFHHLAPHRRLTYIDMIKRALKKEGYFGIACFNPKGAPTTSDWEVYEGRSLKGGIGYSEERFREIFERDFDMVEFREMKKLAGREDLFGVDFLWVSLMRLK